MSEGRLLDRQDILKPPADEILAAYPENSPGLGVRVEDRSVRHEDAEPRADPLEDLPVAAQGRLDLRPAAPGELDGCDQEAADQKEEEAAPPDPRIGRGQTSFRMGEQDRQQRGGDRRQDPRPDPEKPRRSRDSGEVEEERNAPADDRPDEP